MMILKNTQPRNAICRSERSEEPLNVTAIHYGQGIGASPNDAASASRRANGVAGWLLVFVMLLGSFLTSCGTEVENKTEPDEVQTGIDHSSPEKVVAAVFAIAGDTNAALLAELCDPLKENDVDTRRICEYASGFDKEGEFPMFFKAGKLDGAAEINGDYARVPFRFGPAGDKRDTMECIRREGKWYLSQF
jgi:hypothetical protein